MFLKSRKTTKIVMIIQLQFSKQQSSMSLVLINLEINKQLFITTIIYFKRNRANDGQIIK